MLFTLRITLALLRGPVLALKLRATVSLAGFGVDWMIVSISGLGLLTAVRIEAGVLGFAGNTSVRGGGGGEEGIEGNRRVAVDDEARSARERSDVDCSTDIDGGGGKSSYLR